MTTLLALVVLWQFQIVVVYVLISLTLAAALRPLVNRLVGRGFLVRAAWLLLYLVALGSFGCLLFFTGEAAIHEIQLLAQTVPVQDAWRLPGWLEGSSFQQELVARLPPPSKLFRAVTGSQGQFVLPALFGFTQGIGGIVSGVLIILLLSIYWSISQIHFERFWLSLLPSGQRKQARDIWRTVESDIGAYIRSQVVQSLLAGLLFGLGYWLLGSPYPALLALAGALACLIPVVGAALAVIPPLLVGLLTSVQLSLFTVLYATHRLDCPGSMGQAAAFQPQMGQSHSDRRSAHCHGRSVWPCRHHRSAALIGCLPDPVEPPGQPPPCFRGCGSGFRPERAARTRVGHHQGNG